MISLTHAHHHFPQPLFCRVAHRSFKNPLVWEALMYLLITSTCPVWLYSWGNHCTFSHMHTTLQLLLTWQQHRHVLQALPPNARLQGCVFLTPQTTGSSSPSSTVCSSTSHVPLLPNYYGLLTGTASHHYAVLLPPGPAFLFFTISPILFFSPSPCTLRSLK